MCTTEPSDISKLVKPMLALTPTTESPLKTALRDKSQTNTPLHSLRSKKINISQGANGIGAPENDADFDLEQVTETTSLKTNDEIPNSTGDNYLILTGTLKRGKKAGQNVDVKVNITKEELQRLETIRVKGIPTRKYCQLNVSKGPHILMWSIFISPIIFLLAFVYCFYLGTITWHNILALYTEGKPLICRILCAPLLILAYPLLIVLATFGMGVYAAIGQISWNWHLWLSEVQDLEKGFFAGLCGFLGLEGCSPYTEVVVITSLANHEP